MQCALRFYSNSIEFDIFESNKTSSSETDLNQSVYVLRANFRAKRNIIKLG